MNEWWLRFLLAALSGGFAASMAEWLFSGDIWLPLYRRHPEAWRSSASDPTYSEKPGILVSTAFSFISATLFFVLLGVVGAHGWRLPALVAFLIWVIVPVPLLLTLSCFMKYSRALAAVHATGWLLKLLIFAVAYALFKL